MAERKKKEDKKAIDPKVEIRYLPPEIVREILYKLPCKSLVKSMSTCKLWHSLTTDRRAVINPSHFLLSDSKQERIHLYSLDADSFNHVTSIAPAPVDYRHDIILPSSYGLACGIYNHGAKEKKMVVFNPITQQTITLTAIPPYDPHDHLMGFGFHPRTNQYKFIVLSPSTVQGDIISGHVVTVQSGRSIWRPVSHSMNITQDSERRLPNVFVAVCADGVLYWKYGPHCMEYNFDILSFDLETEKFEWVNGPKVSNWVGSPLLLSHLTNFQEKLCAVEVFWLGRCCGKTKWEINIWMLVDSIRGDWTPLHRLDFEVELPLPYIFPLCIRHGKVILRQGPMLYSYDVEGKRLRVLKGEHPSSGLGYGAGRAYAETLVSNSLSGCSKP